MRKIAVIVATVLLASMPKGALAGKPGVKVEAVKGPVQITFSLRKSTVKIKKSLWYKLELKNIGKSRLKVNDLIFKNPWAMHENCEKKLRIFVEIIAPDGKPMRTRSGGEPVKFDWEPRDGEDYRLTADEKKEFEAVSADWERRGLSEAEQSVAYSEWNDRFHRRKNLAERRDPAKQFWLSPGASTMTFAWADRGPENYEGRDDDDQAFREGYAQLWSYRFLTPGVYRVRATYDFGFGGDLDKVYEKGEALKKGLVTVSTPFVSVEVLP